MVESLSSFEPNKPIAAWFALRMVPPLSINSAGQAALSSRKNESVFTRNVVTIDRYTSFDLRFFTRFLKRNFQPVRQLAALPPIRRRNRPEKRVLKPKNPKKPSAAAPP
jgi:hypothetical protein